MFLVKILIWIVLIWIVISSNIFQNSITGISDFIANINSNFLAYVPIEIRILYLLLVIGIVFGLVYSFKK